MPPDLVSLGRPPVDFHEALAKHKQLAAQQFTFRINAQSYTSMKDTVHPGVPACPVCHYPIGTPGFVRMDWPVGHPFFGQPIRCPKCNA